MNLFARRRSSRGFIPDLARIFRPLTESDYLRNDVSEIDLGYPSRVHGLDLAYADNTQTSVLRCRQMDSLERVFADLDRVAARHRSMMRLRFRPPRKNQIEDDRLIVADPDAPEREKRCAVVRLASRRRHLRLVKA